MRKCVKYIYYNLKSLHIDLLEVSLINTILISALLKFNSTLVLYPGDKGTCKRFPLRTKKKAAKFFLLWSFILYTYRPDLQSPRWP